MKELGEGIDLHSEAGLQELANRWVITKHDITKFEIFEFIFLTKDVWFISL